jgi:HSP20 family protein
MKYVIPFGRPVGRMRSGNDPVVGAVQRGIESLLEDFARGWEGASAVADDGFINPDVEVSETEKGLEIVADLPGVDPGDVSAELQDGVLTLKGERKVEKSTDVKEKDGIKYHIAERSYGTYLRRFNLPWEADEDNVKASYDKGVLRVFIPRSIEEKKAKKIVIK